MVISIAGVYRQGKIELSEQPIQAKEETPVIVTFLEAGSLDLPARGIDQAQAAELRARLGAIAEDWESPEMAVYDHYDANKSKL